MNGDIRAPLRAIIFDIDGTLADGAHRVGHIQRTDGKPKDWDAYFAALSDDAPIPHLCEIADCLQTYFHIIYVTGRPEEYADATREWIDRHRLPVGTLYARPRGDRRDDDIVKIELLSRIRADGYEPIMAFDDRTRVVRAWRAAGIPCAQVAEGDF